MARKPKDGKRAVIYARFSSHNQRGESIEIQVDRSTEYIADQGLTLVRVYKDEAKTGRNTNRADYQRMLEDAKRGLFDYVVIYKVTRIMRNRDEMALLRIMLRKCGVEILYAGEAIPEGSSGTLMLGLLEVLAEWESDMDSERILEGIQKNAERCMANGHKKYGWDIVDGYYVVNEAEARVLRMVKDMLLSGSIMADCVRACEPYRTKRGAAFTQSTLTKMMRREQNAGVYNYAGHREVGGMPALWSMEEQRMIWKLLDDHARPRKNWSEHRFALTGKLYHGPCEKPMTGTSGTGKSGKTYYYYRCRKCGRKVRRDIIEENVAQATIEALKDEETRELVADLMMQVEEEQSGQKQSELIEAELRDIATAYENIWQAIEKGIAPPGGQERIEALTSRQELLEEELRTAKAIEAVRMERDRILFWLENIGEADTDTILRVFVAKVVLYDDDDLHIAFTFEGQGDDLPLDSLDPGGGVRPNGPKLHHRTIRRTRLYAIWRGFVIVTRYEKGPR